MEARILIPWKGNYLDSPISIPELRIPFANRVPKRSLKNSPKAPTDRTHAKRLTRKFRRVKLSMLLEYAYSITYNSTEVPRTSAYPFDSHHEISRQLDPEFKSNTNSIES